MQHIWEVFVMDVFGPVFLAALNHPIETSAAIVALCGFTVWMEH